MVTKFTFLILFLISSSSIISQKIQNGDFSAQDTGWTNNGCAPEVNPQNVYGGAGSNLVSEIDTFASSCQTVTGFIVGYTYTLNFDCTKRTTSGIAAKSITVAVSGGALSTVVSRPSYSPYNMVTESFSFIATDTTHTISFTSFNNSNTFGLVIDNVTLDKPVEVDQTICFEDSVFLEGNFVNITGTYFDTLTTAVYGNDSIVITNLTVTSQNLTTLFDTICFEDSIFLEGRFVNTAGTYFDTLTAAAHGCDSIIQTNLTVTSQNLTVINSTICFEDSMLLGGNFVNTTGTYYDTLIAAAYGCDSIIQTNLTVTPQNLTMINQTICFEDSIFLGGSFVNTAGTYYDTLTTITLGCDSIIQTNLTVTPQNLTVIDSTICFEDSIFLEGRFVNTAGTYFDTLTTAAHGCDSIIQTNLTVTSQNLTILFDTICFEDSIFLEGKFVNTAGTYFDTLTTAAHGCDSIIQTNLTVTSQNLTILFDTICFEDSVFLEGRFVNTSGTYFDTLTAAAHGCDSIIQTNLTMTPQNLTVIDSTICFEDSIFLEGRFINTTGTYFDTLTAAANGCDRIVQTNLTVISQNLTVINSTICFEDSVFLGGNFVNTTGTYYDTLTAASFGCDSIIQTNLTVTPLNLTMINSTICFEDSVFLGGNFVNTTGTYYDTLTAASFGCDSIIQTNLTVTSQNLTVINSTICYEDSVFLGGSFVNTSGTYFDTLIATAFGCDSIIQTNLTVISQNLTVINSTICFEDSMLLGGSFVNTAGTYYDTLIATSFGCDSIIQTNLTVTPQNLTVINSTICFEDSMFLGGSFVNTSGTYFDTLVAASFGCDSIIQTNLTIISQFYTVINQTICFEDSIFLEGKFVNISGTYYDTLTATVGCDSIIQTNLTVTPQNLIVINSTICFEDSMFLGGSFVNTSGTYFDTLVAASFGCDSIIQTNLTIISQFYTVINQTICFEDSIFLEGKFVNISGTYYDTLTATVGCDSIIQTNLTVTPQNLIVINSTICFEDSVFLGGSFVNTAGTYFDTLIAAAFGCDSIIQTNLIVTPQNLTVINQIICFEDSVFLGGSFVNSTGIYFDTLTAANFGCDSIIQTNLTVIPQNLTVINQTICFEDSVFLGGSFVNTTGIYFDTLISAAFGCDSIIQTNLIVTPQNLTVINQIICFEDSVFLGGNFVNTTGTYYDTLTATVGCDSIIQTNLTVTPQNLIVINSTICFEDSVFLGGNFVNTAGTYFDTLIAAAFGCDSIIQTNLTVIPQNLTVINQTICFEDSVSLGGNFVNTTGIYFDTLIAADFGCDSIIQTNLTVTPQNLTMINQTICFEDSVFLGGSFVNTTGIYFDTLIAAAFGCDSIIQTNLTVIPQNFTVTNQTICFEDFVFLGGKIVNTSGTYFDTLITGNFGCLSITQTNLTVTPQNLTVINQTICFEDSVFLDGKFVNTTGTYFDTLMTTGYGCDSIIQTNLTVTPQNLTVINSTICFEDSMFLGGRFVNTTGTYFDTLTAAAFGCDSIIQTNLTVTSQNLTVINQTICFEDSMFLGGNFVNSTGIYFDTLTAANFGCDSIIQTNLTVIPQNLTVINQTICFEDSVFLGGNFVNTTGIYFDTMIATAFGCDSIIQTNLTVTPQNLTVINQTICFEDSVFLGGSFVNTTGIYFDTLIAAAFGCDSIIQTNLTVIPQNFTVTNQTICFEDSVFLSGNFVNISGTYFDTLTAAAFDCDSIIQTNLTVTPQNLTVINSTICFEDSVLLGGNFVNTTGTYFDTLTAAAFGCDSIIQTNLTVTPQNLTVINSTICFEDSMFLGGSFVNTTGTYFDTLTAAAFACDSIIQTNLTVTPQNLTVINQTICFEDSILLGGNFVNTTGTYFDTLTAAAFACDSIIQTNLTVTPQNLTVINQTICFEDSIFLGGNFVNTTGTYFDTLTAAAFACDSIIQTNLTVTAQNLIILFDTICNIDSVYLEGKFVSSSGIYFDTLTSTSLGCDSIISTYLFVIPPLGINLGNDTILCGKEVLTITLNYNQATYLWDNGSILNWNTLKDGVNFVKVTQNGCSYYDSITITTAPIPLVNIGEDFEHCFSYSSTKIEVKDLFQSYLWNTGETTQLISIDSEGIYSVEVISNAGCVGEQTITVENKCPFYIFVPNAFTPDNDGVNDLFLINADNATITNWKVFNRWGEKIFEGNSNSDSWDGTFKGKNVQNGTYTYIIYYTAENNSSSINKIYGHVLLIR